MEFCTAKNCKNDSETLQKLRNGKNLCKLTKVLDFDWLQGKVPEPLRPRKLGQLPALRGAFSAGEARAKSRPSQGRWPSASDGRRGSAALRFTQTFLQYHLDTTPQPCYSLTIKSVEEEKYRSISAQRARRLV